MYIEIVMLDVLNVRVDIMCYCVEQSEAVSRTVIMSLPVVSPGFVKGMGGTSISIFN